MTYQLPLLALANQDAAATSIQAAVDAVITKILAAPIACLRSVALAIDANDMDINIQITSPDLAQSGSAAGS
jgi:hypothetical protein